MGTGGGNYGQASVQSKSGKGSNMTPMMHQSSKLNQNGGGGARHGSNAQNGHRNNSVPYSMSNQRHGVSAKRFNNFQGATKKRIENLPRTGIEYPIMKLPNSFIS